MFVDPNMLIKGKTDCNLDYVITQVESLENGNELLFNDTHLNINFKLDPDKPYERSFKIQAALDGK